MTDDSERYVTRSEAAALLGVTRQTTYTTLPLGPPDILKPPGVYLWRRSTIARMAKERACR